MIRPAIHHQSEPFTVPKLPKWVAQNAKPDMDKTPHTIEFIAGAAFAMLDMILQQWGESIPKPLLRNTLAMKAAVVTSKLEGRLATQEAIRDAYHLTPPDNDGIRHWGPDGDVLDFWRQAVTLKIGSNMLADNLERLAGANFESLMDGLLTDATDMAKGAGLLSGCVKAVKSVLAIDDRAERVACLLSDNLLAKFFGWEHSLPLTALHLTKAQLRDLRNGEDRAGVNIQIALIKSTQTVFQVATELANRAAALQAVAPKLRSKASDDAVALFLTEDVIAPSGMLSPTIKGTGTKMTDRAARRLCDRLVELGVTKELTGRSTFRLYGL